MLKHTLFTILCQFLQYNKVIQLCMPIFFLIFFSIMVYHRILNVVTCAIQWDLVYPAYIQQLVVVWSLSRVWLVCGPKTVACHTALSTGFPRHGCQTGVPFPSPNEINFDDKKGSKQDKGKGRKDSNFSFLKIYVILFNMFLIITDTSSCIDIK